MGARVEPTRRAEHRAGSDDRVRTEPAARPDHDRPPQARRWRDLRAGIDPAGRAAPSGRRDRRPDLAAEEVLVRLEVFRGSPDVEPVPVRDVTEERDAAVEEEREELALHREDLPLRDEIEQRSLEHVHAAVDRVGRDLVPARLLQEAADAEPVRGRILHRREVDARLGATRLVLGQHRAQVEVGQHVAVEHDQTTVDEIRCVPDAARGAERLLLDGVAEPHGAEPVPAHDGTDDVGPVRHRQDDVVHAVRREERELVVQERHVEQGDDGLRAVQGEGAQPRPHPAGQDDGLEAAHRAPPGGGAHGSASAISITGIPSRIG